MPSRNGKATLTADDIVATISRSQLPSVVSEGNDDIIALRRLEDELVDLRVNLIPAGGRTIVLQVFERRHELPPDLPVFFIADKDLWVFSVIPSIYISPEICFTDGYSLENDLYRDAALERLLTKSQKEDFSLDLSVVSAWYAKAVSRILIGEDEKIKIHPNEILDYPDRRAAALALRPGETINPDVELMVMSDYTKYLRGKTLIQLLVRHAEYQNARSLLEIAAAHRGPRLCAILEAVAVFFRTRAVAGSTGAF